MEQQQQHHKQLIIAAVLTTQILLSFAYTNLAFAQDTPPTTPTPAPDATPAAEEATCEAIDNPPENTQYLVTTVVEEEFAASQIEDADAKIITCFRETKREGEGSTSWTSSYKSSCSPVPGFVECKRVQVYFTKTGSALLYSYIGLIYRWGASTIGVISVLYLVWGGIQITMAGDNSGKVDEAKKKIFQSLAGLIILFLSGVLLYTINPNFFTAT